jgi:DNA-binding transcriptional LysR family regulator
LEYFKKNDIVPKIIMELDNSNTILRLASAGEGIAIASQSTVEANRHLFEDTIAILHLPPSGLFWTIVAVRKEENKDNFIQNELIKAARDSVGMLS